MLGMEVKMGNGKKLSSEAGIAMVELALVLVLLAVLAIPATRFLGKSVDKSLSGAEEVVATGSGCGGGTDCVGFGGAANGGTNGGF